MTRRGVPLRPAIRANAVAVLLTVLIGSPGVTLQMSRAQTPTPITPSGLGTQINLSATPPAGTVQYDITGGTRPGGGANLFHSFGEFGVPTNNIANFLNETPNLETSNILARVTGTNGNNPTLSSIYGTIQTTGFENANLFLMNPAGFLFGPNATVHVGGMVAFTTADYLRLTNGILFNTTPNPAADALLSAAPVAAFGFLGSNPAAIAIQGSTLAVQSGHSISLVGGNQGFTYTNPDTGSTASAPTGVTVTGGRLMAPGGQINIASVSSPGEVSAVDFTPVAGMTMGGINLSQGATLDVSGNTAGTVRIRGGQLVIADATVSADTVNFNGAPTALDIRLTGDLLISDTLGIPCMTARTVGDGNAGAIQVNSANLVATSSSPASSPFALIDTHTSGIGAAGDINIATGNLKASYQGPSLVQFIDSGTAGPGHGGDVTISAQTVTLEGIGINAGPSLALIEGLDPTGSSGNVAINADRLMLLNSNIDTSVLVEGPIPGGAGSITLNAREINLTQSVVTSLGFGGSGAVLFNADKLIMDGGTLDSRTVSGPGGGIIVNARGVELLNGSTMTTSTFGDGQAGDIHVTATDHVTLSTSPFNSNASGFFGDSLGGVGGNGSGGSVVVITPRLDMTGGSQINTVTLTSGSGGNVTINAANSISISGEFSSAPEPIFGIGTIHPGGIFTQTLGSEFCAGPCGGAGRVSITTGSLAMGSGAQIDTGTGGIQHGGDISIHATNSISMSGTLSDGSPGGIFSRSISTSPDAGSGGNIALFAGQSVTLTNGSSISASSAGPGNAGNIMINAGLNYTSTDSRVTTVADQSSGGNITVLATDMVHLTNSQLNASVQGSSTTVGGNITIDPQYVILQNNSKILAQATQGQGGAISITITNGGLFLPDATSTVSASSQFGVNGTVTIQSPNAPASGKIQPLGKTPLQATSLLNQHCAALAGGEFSSFTVAGRDSLPTEPGSWLASPLYAAGVGEGRGARGEGVRLAGMGLEAMGEGERPVVRGAGLGVRGEGREGMSASAGQGARGVGLEGETALLSLRQIAPAGFLTQAFAVDWSAGCQS